MRRMGRQENDTPMRNPIDMAPDFRAGPYKPLPITPDYERPMPSPLPITPDYERGPYRPLPITPDYDRQLPIPPDYGPGPMPMPFQPPFTPEEFDDYFNRRTGFNTSETARENFISRTDGGYPDRQDPSFMDRYGDYINRGLDYMPSPIGIGSRILKGLPNLLDYPSFVRDTDSFGDYPDEKMRDPDDDEASGIMRALPTREGYGETAGLYQQWKKIADKLGEAYANDWLASQQAV